jgi:hypothetical protein
MDKDYAQTDLTEGKAWSWKTKQTPEMLLKNVKLILNSWESLTLEDIEITSDGLMGISRPKYMITNKKGVQPERILYKTTCPRS